MSSTSTLKLLLFSSSIQLISSQLLFITLTWVDYDSHRFIHLLLQILLLGFLLFWVSLLILSFFLSHPLFSLLMFLILKRCCLFYSFFFLGFWIFCLFDLRKRAKRIWSLLQLKVSFRVMILGISARKMSELCVNAKKVKLALCSVLNWVRWIVREDRWVWIGFSFLFWCCSLIFGNFTTCGNVGLNCCGK